MCQEYSLVANGFVSATVHTHSAPVSQLEAGGTAASASGHSLVPGNFQLAEQRVARRRKHPEVSH